MPYGANSYIDFDTCVVDAIEQWRKRHHFYFNGDYFKAPSCDKVIETIQSVFDYAANKPSQPSKLDDAGRKDFADGIRCLERFVVDRTTQLQSAIKPYSITVRPKTSKNSSRVFDRHNFHTDYDNEHVQYRFLDAVRCPPTVIASNNDAEPCEQGYQFRPQDESNVAIYQAPADSFLLITQPRHSKQPILHSQPFVYEEAQEIVPRTTISYDIVT